MTDINWRFRTNWRGKLILQVGWREPLVSGVPGETYIKWADATTEDLGHYYAAIRARSET